MGIDNQKRVTHPLNEKEPSPIEGDNLFLDALVWYSFTVKYVSIHRERAETRPSVVWMSSQDLTQQQIDELRKSYDANVIQYMMLHEVSPKEMLLQSLTDEQKVALDAIDVDCPEEQRELLYREVLTTDQVFLMGLPNPYDLSWQYYLARMTELVEQQFGSAEELLFEDYGAGTGKNAKLLLDKGHTVFSSDTSVIMNHLRSSRLSGYPTARNMGVKDLMDPMISTGERVHAILIDSAIAHVPKSDVSTIFGRLANRLMPGGILTVSFRELNEEGRQYGSGVFQVQDKLLGTRYFTAWSKEELVHMLTTSPLAELYEIVPYDNGTFFGESPHQNSEMPNFLCMHLRKIGTERII